MSSLERDDVRPRSNERTSFSRSPHPYRRRAQSLLQNEASSSGTDVAAKEPQRSSDSSEDQAIEADDEKGRLLRLPAPPLRARKGLRSGDDPSVSLTPGISPIASPVNEKPGFDFGSSVEAEQAERKQQEKLEQLVKYNKRRRTEIARRVTETILLLIIGALSVFNSHSTCEQPACSGLLKWTYELKCFFSIIGICYALYPVRRSISLLQSASGPRSAVRRGFHTPSRFDPGILLYPVLLPLFIGASLNEHNYTIVFNIILGLASMPRQVIPLRNNARYSLHWILSLIPVSALPPLKRIPVALKLDRMVYNSSTEEMSLFFPLHHNLVVLISDLVTTSLDPAEIELLATGLINLLVLAGSPTGQVLKALLWVGGLSIWIFCEFALQAEVTLARIPAWRFARNRPTNKGLIGRMNRILRALLPEGRSRFAVSSSSDSEDEISDKLRPANLAQKSRTMHQDDGAALHKIVSADENTANGSASGTVQFPKLARSSTFAMYGRAATVAIRMRKIAKSPNPYPKLNYLHAQALKISLAVYVYIAVAVVILIPVRYFIQQRATFGEEPIGWAIGYFIGDIQQARLFIVSNNLDRWIRLPIHKSEYISVSDLPHGNWLDEYRRRMIGASNGRLLLAGYCFLVVAISIVVVLRLNNKVEVDTRRKVFHGAMVAMLLPTIPVDPSFFSLALMIVLAVFLMLDLFRAAQLPPISRPLTNFLAPYVDGRDYRGPVVVSHMFLLIGCAIPLWLSLADWGPNLKYSEAQWNLHWEVEFRSLSMISGVVCVGMGDAAASLIGRRYGKTKWYWGGGKSIEGSAAFAVAVTIGLVVSWLWLRIGGWQAWRAQELPRAVLKSFAAGIGASVMESTLTSANDNVVVPIGLWLLVRGLRI